MNDPVTMQALVAAVTEEFGQDPRASNRTAPVIAARRAFIYVCAREGNSDQAIAAFLEMDRTTIRHHLEQAFASFGAIGNSDAVRWVERVQKVQRAIVAPPSLKRTNDLRATIEAWAQDMTAEERGALRPITWLRLYKALGIDQ